MGVVDAAAVDEEDADAGGDSVDDSVDDSDDSDDDSREEAEEDAPASKRSDIQGVSAGSIVRQQNASSTTGRPAGLGVRTVFIDDPAPCHDRSSPLTNGARCATVKPARRVHDAMPSLEPVSHVISPRAASRSALDACHHSRKRPRASPDSIIGRASDCTERTRAAEATSRGTK